jgi:hypothetical protein
MSARICRICGETDIRFVEHGNTCWECDRKIRARRRNRLTIIVLKLHGPCRCCGEDKIEFLTIDHVYGRAVPRRRGLKRDALHPNLRKIIDDGEMPDHLQILCMNCNWSLGRWGYCPHNPGHVRDVRGGARRGSTYQDTVSQIFVR